MNKFYIVCKRRKLKVTASKGKMFVFERRESEVIDFAMPDISQFCLLIY